MNRLHQVSLVAAMLLSLVAAPAVAQAPAAGTSRACSCRLIRSC